MHVGIISPEFPPEIGGIQTYAYEFVRELARRGHEVTVFTQQHPEGETSISGVDIVPELRLRRAVDRHLLKGRAVDVWHVMNAAYAWVALEAAPVVVSVHGNDFLRPYIAVERPVLQRIPGFWRSARWRPALERRLGMWFTRRSVHLGLPRAAHIFTNSKYTERVLLRHYPNCRGITSAAMVGVSPAFLNAAPNRALLGREHLITVCRLAERRKNVDAVLRALALLKNRYAFDYTVVGDGPLRPGLEALVLELELRDRVHFTGQIDNAVLRSLLATSDLFVLPSSVHPESHEGFGIAYLEANACGTPVLAARLAGAIEAVEEGVSGMFVDSPIPGTIAAALERFFSGSVAFEPTACRRFASRFSWTDVVGHAVRYYTACHD